jgi:acyl carrier protein
MTQQIINKLRNIIADELDVNLKQDQIDDGASLWEDGIGLDSVTLMEFISLIEASFSVQFLDEELDFEQFKDLTTLAAAINTKLLNQEKVS